MKKLEKYTQKISNAHETIDKNHFEKKAWAQNTFVCGIDEVGRGSLAGPLVVAAAIIPQKCNYPLLKDSKKLSEKKRCEAALWIKKQCWYTITFTSPEIIDRYNIYQATLMGMKKALWHLASLFPVRLIDCVIVDAMPLNLGDPYKKLSVHSLPRAEDYSSSVAAASIIAKVTRDELMRRTNTVFPCYSFDQHKGYGTALHRKVLQNTGRSCIHRSSFIKTLWKNGYGQTSLY